MIRTLVRYSLLATLLACASAHNGKVVPKPRIIPHTEWQVTPPLGVFLVARADGEPVGCGAVRPLVDGPADVAEIKRMYTTPEARGRGISRAILARLEAEAAGFGYRRVQLESGLRQPEALRLYETSGYQRIADYGQYAGHELTVCFGKELPPG